MEIYDGVDKCLDMARRWKARKIFVEKVANTKVVGSVLNRRRKDLGTYVVIDPVSVIGKGSKDSPDRAGNIAGAMQMGFFHVPYGAKWLGDMKYELSMFPKGRNDDIADALALIGMKLDTIHGAEYVADFRPQRVVVEPHGASFEDILKMNRRRRLRLPSRKDAMVIHDPGMTPLDEDWDWEQFDVAKRA